MEDRVLERFLARQEEEGMALAQQSDLLDLTPVHGAPPVRYIAHFRCKGLVRVGSGEIREADQFAVGVWFPHDYLRRADPYEVLTWLGPRNIWHPNISDKGPLICVGRLGPGTGLVDIVYQVYEIISYNKVTMREDDALNREACGWARHNQHRFPVDTRPLKRRALNLRVDLRENTDEAR